ncbi:MAG: CPBP family glutamic-type intramembrane protease [Polyangiaceae bacterium]
MSLASPNPRIASARGPVTFVLLTFALSWIPCVLLGQVWTRDVPQPLRFLIVSIIYGVSMGWQPLVAVWIVRRFVDRGWLDDVLTTPRSPYFVLAAIAPPVLAGTAMGIALVAGQRNLIGTKDVAPLPQAGTLDGTLLVLACMCAALTTLWIQALAEEVAWRGYYLTRTMQRFGPLRGLALHGAVWGLWYAPCFLAANGATLTLTSALRCLAFILTCMLLGALLGWLRLASSSVLPTTLANSALTVTAGLPLLLHGEDPGVRGAVYGPAGWAPMLLILGVILVSRYRRAIRVPRRPEPSPWLLWMITKGKHTSTRLH